MKYLFLTLYLTGATILCAQAQATAVAGQTLNITLNDVIDIKFVATQQNAGSALQMTFSSPDDYYNGVESAPQQLRVRTNKGFTVSVRTTDATANNAQQGQTPSFIYIKVPENSTGGSITPSFSSSGYKNVTRADLALLKDCTKGGNQTFTVQYKAMPGFMISPGVYMIDVIFTATRF